MPLQPVIVRSEPGIKRDGTKFEGNHYVDGQWCRFQRGLPRKMGGYRALQDQLDGIARGMHIHNHNAYTYVMATAAITSSTTGPTENSAASSAAPRAASFTGARTPA